MPVRLGMSTTNCHAYSVFVSGVGLMIASNTWLAELKELKREEDREWLSTNSVLVHVDSPLFLEGDDAEGASVGSCASHATPSHSET